MRFIKSSEIKRQSAYLRLLVNMVETYSLLGDEMNFLRITNESLDAIGFTEDVQEHRSIAGLVVDRRTSTSQAKL